MASPDPTSPPTHVQPPDSAYSIMNGITVYDRRAREHTVSPLPETVYVPASGKGCYHYSPACGNLKYPHAISTDPLLGPMLPPCRKCVVPALNRYMEAEEKSFLAEKMDIKAELERLLAEMHKSFGDSKAKPVLVTLRPLIDGKVKVIFDIPKVRECTC